MSENNSTLNNIQWSESGNNINNFAPLIKELMEKVTVKLDRDFGDLLYDLIIDIKNLNIEGYQKRVPEVSFGEKLEPKFQKVLIKRLEDARKRYINTQKKENKKKEQQVKKEEFQNKLDEEWNKIKQDIEYNTEISKLEKINEIIQGIDTKEYSKRMKNDILKKINIEKENEENRMKQEQLKEYKRQQEEAQKNEQENKEIEKIWSKTIALFEKEKERKMELIEFLQKRLENNKTLSETVKLEIIKRLNKEEDNIYIQEVKKFTRDFNESFEEITSRDLGNRKFKHVKCYERFCSLRDILSGSLGTTEQEKITTALEEDGISQADKEILNLRLENIKSRNITR